MTPDQERPMKRLARRAIATTVEALAVAVLVYVLLVRTGLIQAYGRICQSDPGGGRTCAVHSTWVVWFWNLGERVNYYGAAITALATVFVATFTYTLWRTSAVQARQLQASLDLATKEFLATHRPRLVLLRVSNTFLGAGAVDAVLEIANTGDSEAELYELGIDIFPRQSGEQALYSALPDAVSAITIPPGKIAQVRVKGKHRLTDKLLADINVGSTELCLLLIANYRDGAGIDRSTGAFRLYRPARRRFVPASPDDEFAEREFAF